MSFNAFNLHPRILSSIEALGFSTPTPIQKEAIPAVLADKDVLGLAQTGTGKTAAFVVPILNRLMEGPKGRVRALIIAPTRELAQQIHESICSLGKDTGLRSVPIYGGQNIHPQMQKLRRGVEIVVACPGRLLDHLERRTIDLRNLEVLVLDEADQMFDMGFLPAIHRILEQVPENRQSLLFSATMPKAIHDLAKNILHNPVNIKIGQSAPTKSVTQSIFPVAQHLKTELLIKILQTTEIQSVLIFTKTKHKAKSVADQLNFAGYKVASLQGNLSQSKRQSTLNDFRKGSLQILVATDIASRGIDVDRISHVINYDMPDTVEAYTHRIGRTGRASKTGDAFTLLTNEDRWRVKNIERVLGTRIEQRMIESFDYKAAAAPRAPRSRDDNPRRFRDRPERSERSNHSDRSDRSDRGPKKSFGGQRPSNGSGFRFARNKPAGGRFQKSRDN